MPGTLWGATCSLDASAWGSELTGEGALRRPRGASALGRQWSRGRPVGNEEEGALVLILRHLEGAVPKLPSPGASQLWGTLASSGARSAMRTSASGVLGSGGTP